MSLEIHVLRRKSDAVTGQPFDVFGAMILGAMILTGW
jgi:hypothetical protein